MSSTNLNRETAIEVEHTKRENDSDVMSKRHQKRVAKLNEIVKIIREKGPIGIAKLAFEAKIGWSTLYQYKELILDMFPDIEYVEEIFRVKESSSHVGK